MNAKEAAEAMRRLAEHPASQWTKTRVVDRRMDKQCARCGAIASKELPIGASDGPEHVPAGFDEELHAWITAFLDRHASCAAAKSALEEARAMEPSVRWLENGADAREALRDEDTRILFDGRTLVVECTFYTVIHHAIVSERVRAACAGPKLRMVVGGLSRAADGALVTKTFINTDETYAEVGARVRAMNPRPSRATPVGEPCKRSEGTLVSFKGHLGVHMERMLAARGTKRESA